MQDLCTKNKGADHDQLQDDCTADLHLCFRICKSMFSHDTAQVSRTVEEHWKGWYSVNLVFKLQKFTMCSHVYLKLVEPQYEKTCLRGFLPVSTQTGLYSLEISDFESRGVVRKPYYVVKTKVLISCAADLPLCFCICKKLVFS